MTHHHKGSVFLRLSALLDDLQFGAEQGHPILIEGRKDEEALQNLGITGNFIKVSGSGLKLFEIAENAVKLSSRVIILTDFDRKGNELAKKLAIDIQNLGSHPDLYIRQGIMGLTYRYIKDIQSLPRHIEQLKYETGLDDVQIAHPSNKISCG